MHRRLAAGGKTSLTLVRQNQGATPFDTHENAMPDPESDVAEQLAQALRHYQKNLIGKDQAKQNVAAPRRLESLSEDPGTDD